MTNLLKAVEQLRREMQKTLALYRPPPPEAPPPRSILPATSEAFARQLYKQFLTAHRDHHRYNNLDWFRAGIAMRERLDGHKTEFPKGTK